MQMPEWREEYSVGIEELDNQHKELFAIGARLASAVSTGASVDVAATVTELIEYAMKHFKLEERIMEDAGYEHLEYHRTMHEFMRTRVDLLAARVSKGLLTTEELAEFMETWLTEHIIMEDMRYITTLHSKKR